MKKRTVIIAIAIIVSTVWGIGESLWGQKKKSEVLFPKREYVNRHSEYFFKQVSLQQPLIEKVAFFANSDAYLSAYLAFSPYLEKQAYVIKLIADTESRDKVFLQQFGEAQKEITLENYPQYLKKSNTGKSLLFRAILYSLVYDYRRNKLSGNQAFRLWNILLRLVESAYREKSKKIENAELLEMASHLIFFKKITKWQKRAKKIRKHYKGRKS